MPSIARAPRLRAPDSLVGRIALVVDSTRPQRRTSLHFWGRLPCVAVGVLATNPRMLAVDGSTA
eukprot:7385364-Prymnesium_polylepis.2